jgi:hypothetical protein
MIMTSARRTVMKTLVTALAIGTTDLLVTSARAEAPLRLNLPRGATSLAGLTDRLANAPRRRDFKTVPMILDNPDQWDAQALSEVLAYKPTAKQAWDNTDVAGSWLGVMRNSLNTQVWSFRHPDFLVVSATHGTAQFALYDQEMWDKYGLAKLADKSLEKNSLIVDRPAAAADPTNYEDPAGIYSSQNISIPALQRRGVIFMSCHNAIWEHATRLHDSGANPDKLAVDGLAAELTNHLIPGAVLIPGAAGTLPELQRAGFQYAR